MSLIFYLEKLDQLIIIESTPEVAVMFFAGVHNSNGWKLIGEL